MKEEVSAWNRMLSKVWRYNHAFLIYRWHASNVRSIVPVILIERERPPSV